MSDQRGPAPPGPTVGETTGAAPVVPPGRQLFRFVVGVAAVAPGRLATALQAVGEVARTPPPPAAPAAPRHVLIGALSALPAWLADSLARADPVARRWGGRATQLLPRRLVLEPLDDLRKLVAQHAATWSEVGRREEQAGRQLVEQALQVVPDSVLAAVSESADLRRVMSEQTAGITRTAVDRLRETSARADDLSESVVRRVFRRRSRPEGP
jgi:hypothetical protein